MKKFFNLDLLFFLSLFLIFLLPPTDPDLGWHLRCGQEFWQKQTLCNLNQFSVLLPDYSWPNHYWLYQAILFPIYQFFGFWGLTFFNAIVMSFSLFFFYKSSRSCFFSLFSILILLFFSWSIFNLGIRSQLMSFFFFSLLLFLFSKIRQIRLIGLIIPLVFLFWANSHGGSVVLGIYLLVFFLLSSPISLIRQICLICLISFLATLLNPFGLAIYKDAFRHLNGPVNLSQIIAEWVPPAPLFWWLIVITVLIFSLFVFFFGRNRRNFLLFLFTLPLAFLALKARRNTPFYFLFFFYALGESGIFKKWSIKKDFSNPLSFSLVIFLLLITPFISLPAAFKTNSSLENYAQNSSVIYPLDAIKFLKKQPDRGNVFNRYEWGGFLIWQLPEQKIFADGRMPAWTTPSGKSPYTIYLKTLQTQPGWQKTLKEYNLSWILIVPNTFMDLLLRENPEEFGWKEAYRDKIAVLYQRL